MEDKAPSKADVSTPINCTCKKDSCFSTLKGYWKLLIMFFVVFVYLMIGGLIFNATERPNELQTIEDAQNARNQAFVDIVQMLVNSTNLNKEQALNLTTTLIVLAERAGETIPSNSIWDFSSAVFFATTVITTIGYGTIAPVTAAGQVLFIFYALIGIPLALIFLAEIGSIVDEKVDQILKPVEKRWGSATSRIIGSISLFLAVVLIFVLIPGFVFSAIEEWNLRESIYFTVVTLTTVGFGDFVPAQRNDSIVSFYKLVSVAWLWIGLALVATLITEVQKLLKALGKWYHMNNYCRRKILTLKQRHKLDKEYEKTSTTPSDTLPAVTDL